MGLVYVIFLNNVKVTTEENIMRKCKLVLDILANLGLEWPFCYEWPFGNKYKLI